MKNKGENLIEKKLVMLQWKKAYLEAIIDELRPFGEVLEVGFAGGHAAERIQSFKPKSHLIIEKNPQAAKEARQWAKKYPNVSIVEGTWQSLLTQLPMFDTIFFNDYPLDSEMGMMSRIHPEEITQTSQKAKELLDSLQNQLSTMTIQYLDKDIEDFYQKTGRHNLQELPSFFEQMKENGFITDEQYKKASKKYQLDEIKKTLTAKESQDPMFEFLAECIKSHMRKGSRFSSFSKDIISKYEDSQFFENIITNPYFDFIEKVVPIKVPKFSDYYKFDDALIFVVEKFS